MSEKIFVTGFSTCQAPPHGTFVDNSEKISAEFKIPERTFKFSGDIAPSQIGAECIKQTLESLWLDPLKADFLISASSTPDFNNPSLSQSILGRFESWHIGGIEIRQSAAGFDYALNLARNLTASKIYNSVVIVACEFLARAFNSFSENSADEPTLHARRISSDAAVSCLVANEYFINQNKIEPQYLLLDSLCMTDGAGSGTFTIPIPSSSRLPLRLTPQDLLHNRHLPKLEAKNFVKAAQPIWLESYRKFNSGAAVKHALHSPVPEIFGGIKGYDVFEQGGYCGSAGIGMALAAAANERVSGEKILTCSVGSGINLGFSLLEGV